MKCRQIATIEIETDDENESFEKYIGKIDENTRIWGVIALTKIPHISKDQEDTYYSDVFIAALDRHVQMLKGEKSTQEVSADGPIGECSK